MANIVTEATPYSEKGEKHLQDSTEKISFDSDRKPSDDVEVVKEMEAFEDRLLNDDASEQEYLVQSGSDVAIKVPDTASGILTSI